MSAFSLRQRTILDRTIKGSLKKAVAARLLKVSRKTIYIWLSIRRAEKAKRVSLPKHKKHHVLAVASKNPQLGPKNIAQELNKRGIGGSTSSVWKTLKGLNLHTCELREDKKQMCRELKNTKDSMLPGHIRLTAETRKRVVEEVLLSGKKVSEVIKIHHISRKTFLKWKNRYEMAQTKGEHLISAMRDQNPEAHLHPRGASESTVARVLDIVVEFPELSSAKIAKKLGLGNHGIQRILERENLSTLRLRQAYSSANTKDQSNAPAFAFQVEKPKAQQTFVPNHAPAPPPARFTLLKHFSLSAVIAFPLSLATIYWFSILFSVQSVGQFFGIIFATLSLIFGTFFFLYSLKYYITLILILSFSQRDGENSINNIKGGILGWILGNTPTEPMMDEKPAGLEANLDNIKLNRYPFVSVQIPFYNEKNVVERSIMAAASFDYPGDYEIILCDDSTDSTTQIIQDLQKKHLAKNEALHQIKGDGWILSSVEIKPGVFLKHLHRTTRSGYKGGALNLAMTLVDPRTEFVSIFDADFVPYPDTLNQFLKYFKVKNNMTENYTASSVAAVQGYQWHVLNKSENWITRGVRSEYAGSYVIERAGVELYGGLKQISGSVYMIRRDALEDIGWGTSITEDFELTLKLYAKGYKVVYTPYIQAPAECVSTIKRLIRQRMRWAEGHSFNIKLMWKELFFGKNLTKAEKFELVYLIPYYLQAFFFIMGTLAWFVSETILKTRLPFWTALWGWSLVLTNMLSLPLMNAVGLFLEESEEKDYVGISSFIALSYIVVPFQAYAAVKGFLEKAEGPWFRTPKTGRVTDILKRGAFYKLITDILPKKFDNSLTHTEALDYNYLALTTSNNRFNGFNIRPRKIRWIGNLVLVGVLSATSLLVSFAPFIQVAETSAHDYSVASIADIKKRASQTEAVNKPIEKDIVTPRMIRKQTESKENVEYTFHKEPRVNIKLDDSSVDITTKRIGGKILDIDEAVMVGNNKANYKSAIEGVDITYTVKGGVVVEEFVVDSAEAVKRARSIEQEIVLVNVEISEKEDGSYAFSSDNKEIFTLAQPFIRDNNGILNTGITLDIEKNGDTYKLIKTVTEEGKKWLLDENRAYPVVIDPSVVVTGNIVEADAQFGALQRKLVYINSNWYAFYNDAGHIYYKKSADGTSWGSAVDVDNTDTDNYNPTVSSSGSYIFVAWVDDSGEAIEANTINTGSSDTLGTKCSSANFTDLNSTYMVSAAASSTTNLYFAFADTSTGTNHGIFKLATDTCTFTNIHGEMQVQVGEYDGNGSDDRPITGIGFRPDLVMVRGSTNAESLYMRTSNMAGDVSHDATTATALEANFIQSMDADGFTVGTATGVNGNNTKYYYMAIRENDGTNFKLTSYTGTGTDNKPIPCIADPDSVMVWGNTASRIYFKTSYNSATDMAYPVAAAGGASNIIQALTSTGFTVGTSNNVNANGIDYYAWCVKDTANVFDFYQYTGDGTDSRDILQAGFQPDWAATKPIANINGGIRWKTMAGDTSNTWGATNNAGNLIQAFQSTGFQVGTATGVNTNGTIYHSWAFQEQAAASELSSGDNPVLVYMGTNLHLIFQDGDLSHSIYDGTNWSETVNNAQIANVTDSTYSVVGDGTNLWVMSLNGTTDTRLYKYASGSWTSQTAPFTSKTSMSSISMSYDSTNSKLYAMAVYGASEQAYFTSSAISSISWASETSFAFTAGDLGHLSSNESGAGETQIGVVLRQGSNFEFATLPENIWLLMLGLPMIYLGIKRAKKNQEDQELLKLTLRNTQKENCRNNSNKGQ